MKNTIRLFTLIAAMSLVVACSPARTGVVNNTLSTNQRPSISITPQSPLQLADSGRVWVSPKTDLTPGMTTASFDYAVYANPSDSDPVVMAYGAIIRLENPEAWHFVPQGKTLPDSFGPREKLVGVGREGFLYTLYVPHSGDWASELLVANGKNVPEAWIAKRWLFSLESGVRALAEYREPWPADLSVPASDIMLIGDANRAFLREFDRRAESAFILTPDAQEFSAPPASALWRSSPIPPDVARLAGEVLQNDRSGGEYDG